MTGPIRDFRDLGAWQCAMELADACGDVAAALPAFEAALADQLRRAANAIHACIAEGNGRPTTVDYLRYLGHANSSLNEVHSHLLFVERRYRAITAVQVAIEWVDKTGRPLRALIRSLKEKEGRERRTRGTRRWK
jgi:four helix bundle protein